MPYSDLTDIENQIDESDLIGLTDDEDTGAHNSGRILRAIDDADSEINGYIGMRYTVPLDPVPVLIRKFSTDIAVWNLYARREGAPEDRKIRYEKALEYLKGVAKGIFSLGENDPAETPSDSARPELTYAERIFSREKMRDF
jgi:phage gp36-like protein